MNPTSRRLTFLLSVLLVVGLASPGFAGTADDDWKQILALDAGPRTAFKSRDEARKAALQYLATQEKTLREFVKIHADDPRAMDARLRLAHLLATRGDLEPNDKATAEARRILDEIEKNPATPRERVADAAFGKISIFMQMRREPDDIERESLLGQTRRFQANWPGDKRLAPLLAEVATLFDDQPKTKESLLTEASRLAESPELKQRIQDDQKRLGMLGKPLNLKFTATDGHAIDAADYRGKVVLVYFFANWSPPSILGLKPVRELAQKPGVQAIGISLDGDKAAMEANLKANNIAWPVFFDGKGWESPLVRSLSINTLPTMWLLDHQGRLRTLNARRDMEDAIRQLREER